MRRAAVLVPLAFAACHAYQPGTIPGPTVGCLDIGVEPHRDPEARGPRSIVGATVLSPFDPVVWNRERAHRLFDFEYRIEVYVPAAKRRWGYYVLPVLVDGRIVARVDAKTDRADGVLRIKAAHAEPAMHNADTARQVRGALEDLARFVGVDDVVIEPRGDLAASLS